MERRFPLLVRSIAALGALALNGWQGLIWTNKIKLPRKHGSKNADILPSGNYDKGPRLSRRRSSKVYSVET